MANLFTFRKMGRLQMFKMYFIGKPRFLLDNSDITQEINNKAAALLVLLVSQNDKSDKMVSREKLIGYLWPDSTSEAARYNLRYNLWQLRKIIGPDENGCEFLTATKDHCGINESYELWSDVGELLKFTPNVANAGCSELEHHLALLEGDFFEGCYFRGCDELNERIIVSRNFFDNLKLDMLNRLSLCCCEQSSWVKAIKVLQLSLAMDPYNERNAALLIKALNKTGSRAKAVDLYHSMVNRLAIDLNVKPSEELTSEYENMCSDGICLTGGNMAADRFTTADYEQPQNADCVHISSYAMKTVECFWMASVLEALIESDEIEIGDFIRNESERADLAALSSAIAVEWDEGGRAAEVRTVTTFISLIKRVCRAEVLMIEIENADAMDDVSAEVAEYLTKVCGERLLIAKK